MTWISVGEHERTGRGFEHPAFFMRVDIEISGIEAAPQGSKIRTRYGMREASKRVGPWRDAVRTEALAACGELIEEACSVTVEFRFLRPKGDFGAKGNLLPSARRHYTVKRNDIDKCCRSTAGWADRGGICRRLLRCEADRQPEVLRTRGTSRGLCDNPNSCTIPYTDPADGGHDWLSSVNHPDDHNSHRMIKSSAFSIPLRSTRIFSMKRLQTQASAWPPAWNISLKTTGCLCERPC